MNHGTEVIIYIKEEEKKFLDQELVEKVIKTYSQFTKYKILLYKTKTIEEEVDEEETEEEKAKREEEGKEIKKKKISKDIQE